MSETRAPYQALRPEELHQRETDAQEVSEREYLQEFLNGLNTQAAGIKQQAAAIRKRLGIEEKR